MRRMIFIVVGLLNTSIVSAQHFKSRNISKDSLLNLFEAGVPPFEILSSLKDYSYMDYEAIYNDKRLKPHLMKWLNRDLYLEYKIDQERISVSSNERFVDSLIKLKLRKRELSYDSIRANKPLYGAYKDTVINENIEEYIKTYKQSSPYPPYDAINFHSFLAYPESYNLIKTWWEEQGKRTDRDIYFTALLRMGDPEARTLFDHEIKQFVKTNGDSRDVMEVFEMTRQIGGAYSIDKLLELLKVDKKFIMLSEGDEGRPFNCEIIDYLIDLILYHHIEINDSVKRSSSCKIHFNQISEVKGSAKKLKEKYKVQERYWMSKMPFYEKNN